MTISKERAEQGEVLWQNFGRCKILYSLLLRLLFPQLFGHILERDCLFAYLEIIFISIIIDDTGTLIGAFDPYLFLKWVLHVNLGGGADIS